jgi:hypothetical protein
VVPGTEDAPLAALGIHPRGELSQIFIGQLFDNLFDFRQVGHEYNLRFRGNGINSRKPRLTTSLGSALEMIASSGHRRHVAIAALSFRAHRSALYSDGQWAQNGPKTSGNSDKVHQQTD